MTSFLSTNLMADEDITICEFFFATFDLLNLLQFPFSILSVVYSYIYSVVLHLLGILVDAMPGEAVMIPNTLIIADGTVECIWSMAFYLYLQA